jgi:hypothetical protein
VIALVIAAAAVMSGPRAHAFTERCAELQQDTPTLACARVQQLDTGGHAVEIWQTTVHFPGDEGDQESDTVAFYVAMQDDHGWYVSDSIAGFQTFHENGHHNAGGATDLDRIDARAMRIAGHPAVRVHVVERWSGFCSPCDRAGQHTSGIAIERTTCVLEPSARQCISPGAGLTANIALAAPVTMSGPRPTAFAATCHDLQVTTPALECTRVQALDAGHPVEVWTTTPPPGGDPDDPPPTTMEVFVAIETNAGWYVSQPIFSIGPGELTEQGAPTTTDRIEATATRKDTQHAARIDLVREWAQGHGRMTLTATCVADQVVIPHCETTVGDE